MAAPSCNQFEADLSAFLDRELDAARVAQVEHHLTDCKPCRLMLAELRNVAERLAALPRMPAPRELSMAMRREAERRELLGNRAAPRPPRKLILFAHLSASAAVIAACVFVGWHVIRPPAELNQTRAAAPANVLSGIANEPRNETNDAKRLALRDPSVKSSELDAVRAGQSRELPAVRADLAEPAQAPSDQYAAVPADDLGQAGRAVLGGRPVVDSFAKAEDRDTQDAWAQAAAPLVEIVVTPKDEHSWQRTYALISKWKRLDPSDTAAATRRERAPTLEVSLRKDAELFFDQELAIAANGAINPIRVELLVDPDETGDLIASLEQNAPRQVSARLAADVSALRRLLNASDREGFRGGGFAGRFDRAAGQRLGMVPPEDAPADTFAANVVSRDDNAKTQEEPAGLADESRSRNRTAEKKVGRLARGSMQTPAIPETASTRPVDPAAHRGLKSQRGRENSQLARAPPREEETLQPGGGRGRREQAANADAALREASIAAPPSKPVGGVAGSAPPRARRRTMDERITNRFKKERDILRDEDQSAPRRPTSMSAQDKQAGADIVADVPPPAQIEQAERFVEQDRRGYDRKAGGSASSRPTSPRVTFRVTLLPPRRPPTTMPTTTSSTND